MKQPSSCLRPLFSRAAFGFLSVHRPGAWGRLAEVKVKLKSVFSQRLHRPRSIPSKEGSRVGNGAGRAPSMLLHTRSLWRVISKFYSVSTFFSFLGSVSSWNHGPTLSSWTSSVTRAWLPPEAVLGEGERA